MWLPEAGMGKVERRNWRKVVKRYKFPITRYISTRIIIDSMKIRINIAVHYI